MSDEDVIDDLLDYAWSKTCCHEETYRGGAIWEICRSCGAKWADDEGGKPEWETPQAIRKAEALLARIKEEAGPTHYAVIDDKGHIVVAVKREHYRADILDDVTNSYGYKSNTDKWTVKGVTVHE